MSNPNTNGEPEGPKDHEDAATSGSEIGFLKQCVREMEEANESLRKSLTAMEVDRNKWRDHTHYWVDREFARGSPHTEEDWKRAIEGGNWIPSEVVMEDIKRMLEGP
jgi:hypothetical protein